MSTARSVSFPFLRTSAQPAEPITVLDRGLERQMYMEAASILCGSEFDDAVMAIFVHRPEREMPQAKDSRRRQRKYLFPH